MSPKPVSVEIDASCDILYSSFYILGLWQIFGKENVRFTSKPFRQFVHNNHFFCFIIRENGIVKKIAIDFSDGVELNRLAYDWSDTYGKVNVEFGGKMFYPKMLAIGPSFGIRIFNAYDTFSYAVRNYMQSRNRIKNARQFFADYKNQFVRASLRDIRKRNASANDYIFFVSSLWKKEPLTNLARAQFMLSAQKAGYRFEGGFAPRVKNDIKGFEQLTLKSRVSFTQYLDNLARSAVAFNTPAVLSCHGWKLGEFLAMGKCIISTAISREMPAEFIDAQQFILTDGTEEDLLNKLLHLKALPAMRKDFEQRAAQYFDHWLAPDKVINRLYSMS